MRIALIGPVSPYAGGIARFNETLGAQLAGAGHEVHYLSFKELYPRRLYPGKGLTSVPEGLDRTDTSFLLNWHMLGSGTKLRAWLRGFQPDLIVLHWWVPVHFWFFARILVLCKKNGIPAKVIVHNALPHEPFPFARALTRLALMPAVACIAMAEGETQKLKQILGPDKPVYLTNHPLMPALPTPVEHDPEVLKAKYGVSKAERVLLFLGFVRPYKGLASLIGALAALRQRGKRLHLVVGGEFWDDPETYRTQIKALDIENAVKLIPRYLQEEEIAELFSIADLFVLPYLRGTQSGILKLALGNGLPCVVSDAIADGFVRSHPQRCITYPTGSDEGLQRAIIKGILITKYSPTELYLSVSHSWDTFTGFMLNGNG